MNKRKLLNQTRISRKTRTRAKIFGTADKPRLSVFRSNRYTCIQLINDEKGNTLASASTRELPASSNLQRGEKNKKDKKTILAEQLGELIAKKAAEKGIEKAVFDRSFYKYHGRVKAIAEGARKGGLKL